MKRLSLPTLAFLAALAFAGCRKDDPVLPPTPLDEELKAQMLQHASGDLAYYRMPASDDYGRIPQDPRNPLSAEKVALGRLLFHETGIAEMPKDKEGRNTYSCASCHFAAAGFQAGRVQGLGEGAEGIGLRGEDRHRIAHYALNDIDAQPIRSPSALNGAYQIVTLWNGQFGARGPNIGTEYAWWANSPRSFNHLGYHGLETQAIAGMEVHGLLVDEDILGQYGYKALFDQAFSDWPLNQRYTNETAGLAIAAYERTLLASQAPFQRWLRGESEAMSEVEKAGALLFFGKAACVSCHTGPALNSMEFHALGMKDLFDCPEEVFRTLTNAAEHLGRGGFTGRPEDLYKFKVPQLYNLKDSPFYGHGSSLRSLREVVAYKNAGQPENPRVTATQLAPEFKPLGLSEAEIDAITAFLENALYDPELSRYEPTSLLSGLCFPNNDPLSRLHLGCD